MTRPHPDLESQLAAALHAKSDADELILNALMSLQARLSKGASLPEVCGDLQDVLARMDEVDRGLSLLQERWRSAHDTPGECLRSELARQQTLLESLLSCVHEIAAVAQADRDRLRPELDSAARARRMCAAYAAAGRLR
jgi:hypothetical protein